MRSFNLVVHAEDIGRFKTLIAIVANLPEELQSLFDRMRQACRAAFKIVSDETNHLA
jgi:hypothetical protein